jgi:uncharacterized membrane protein
MRDIVYFMQEIVHIVPVGMDSPDRFLVFKHIPATKVILITGSLKKKGTEKEEALARKIIDKLVAVLGSVMKVEVEETDVFDYKSNLELIARLIKEHEEAEVFINLSSATKIMLFAGFMAASLFGARLYYVSPKEYITTALEEACKTDDLDKLKKLMGGNCDEVYLSRGVRHVSELPVLKMEPPKEEELEILKAIKNAGGKVDRIIDLMDYIDYGVLYKGKEPPRKPVYRKDTKKQKEHRSRKKEFNKERIRFINKVRKNLDSMEKRGYISRTRVGKNARIELLEPGATLVKLESVFM